MADESVQAWTVEKEAEFARSPKWGRWPPSLLIIQFVACSIFGLFQVLSLSVDYPTWQRVWKGAFGFAYGAFAAAFLAKWLFQRAQVRQKHKAIRLVFDILRRHEKTADALRELEQSRLEEDGLPYWTG